MSQFTIKFSNEFLSKIIAAITIVELILFILSLYHIIAGSHELGWFMSTLGWAFGYYQLKLINYIQNRKD